MLPERPSRLRPVPLPDYSGPDSSDPKNDSVGEKLIRWGLFAVLISTIPILVSVAASLSDGSPTETPVLASEFDIAKSRASGFERAFGSGELLLVAATTAAGGVGELVARGTNQMRRYKLFAGGFALVIMLTCSLWFAYIANSIASGEAIEFRNIARVSIVLFVCSVVATGSCIATAEV